MTSTQLSVLHNTYYALRHGKSQANAEGIIISHPEDGVPGFGLVEEGRGQVTASAEAALQEGVLDASTIIISSDFARARETAEIAAKILGTEPATLNPALRERYFGNWDRTHNGNYQHAWNEDVLDPSHKRDNVESVDEVIARAGSLIATLEKEYTGKNILLVSHGDTLQILQTIFAHVSPGSHRSLPHLGTGEIRKLG
jgi:broad specificity phosphatase PhoE